MDPGGSTREITWNLGCYLALCVHVYFMTKDGQKKYQEIRMDRNWEQREINDISHQLAFVVKATSGSVIKPCVPMIIIL